jgi:hypothetical protein
LPHPVALNLTIQNGIFCQQNYLLVLVLLLTEVPINISVDANPLLLRTVFVQFLLYTKTNTFFYTLLKDSSMYIIYASFFWPKMHFHMSDLLRTDTL